MRAKFIYEAFSEKGDPIEDMGIGGYTFNTLKPGALIKLKPEYRSTVALTKNQSGEFTTHSGMQIRHDHCLLVTSIIPYKDGIRKNIHIKKFFWKDDAIKEKSEWQKTGRLGWGGSSNRMRISKLQFERRFNIIERGFDQMTESLDEKFIEVGDPIHDMGIGDPLYRAGAKIEEFAEENGYEFRMKKLVRESLLINENIFSIGLGYGDKYSKDYNKELKIKVDKLLENGSWKNHDEVKRMFANSLELAKMWNEKKPSEISWQTSSFYNNFKRDKSGRILNSNFFFPSPVVFVLLKELVGEHYAISDKTNSNFRHNCFNDAIIWKKENKNTKIIGGIIINKKNIFKVRFEDMVVHAFNEKNGKYYDSTNHKHIVNELIYFPLFEYKGDSESELAEETWKYANSFEKAVKDFGLYPQ